MLLYQIAITLIPGIGDVNAKKLIAYCGSAEAVFHENKDSLMKIPGIGLATVKSMLSQKVLGRAEKEIAYIDKEGITALYFLDEDYPRRLKHCVDGPVMIYFKGNLKKENSKVISIVGTRRITEYGKKMCQQIIEGLSELDILVVSGLAYGVDTEAHKLAVKYGLPTVGVLAHGLNQLYPATNRKLAIKMMENGGLLTEFLSGTNPDRENFPRRNRIVAGLADAIVVVESAEKGGALITANIANSYSRDVFAVPGSLDMEFSKGCNYLIRTNQAALIQSVNDIFYIMRWDKDGATIKHKQMKLFRELTSEEQNLVEVMKLNGPSSIDFLVLKSQLTHSKIAATLLNLEFDGLVKNLPGNRFILT